MHGIVSQTFLNKGPNVDLLFVPPTDVEIYGQFNETKDYLTKCPYMSALVLLEVNGDLHNSSNIVAINIVPLNFGGSVEVPIMSNDGCCKKHLPEGTKPLDADADIGEKNLHVLMDGWGDSCREPCIVGVFDLRETAIDAARIKFDSYESFEDNADTVKEHSVIFEVDEDESYGVAMDTFTLDKEFEEEFHEMELGLACCSGLWMTPEVSDYTEIIKTYSCATCNLKKERNKFSTVSDDERTCKQCSKSKTKECDDRSLNNTLLRVCSGCQIKKGKKRFVKEEFDRPNMERKCKN
mmetsp:Transcript_19499/g.35403  ORF Transcript_19499/g.35403 Transcript_19499/m.35403 type:complete len:295 (-) Transcript_19499:214-1098(-)